MRVIGIGSSRSTAVRGFKQCLGLYNADNHETIQNVDADLLVPTSFTVPYGRGSKNIPFSAEQITGMFLRKLIQSVKSPGDIPTTLHPVPPFTIITLYLFTVFFTLESKPWTNLWNLYVQFCRFQPFLVSPNALHL